VSDWTVDTLKEHFDAILVEKDKAISAALLAAEKAVTKAETASDKRFEGVNEFRQALSDQTNTLVPRTEWQSARDEQERRLRLVEAAATGVAATRAMLIVLAGLLVAAVGVVVALVA
jgi:hypothetical protein